jgi:alginate O-acetyltransferase complex protein AlgJ
MGILLLPFLNDSFHFIKEEPGHENRNKVPKPQFSDTLIEQYCKDYDNYYTDNFNLRQNFIKILNQFQYSFFHVSSIPDRVTIGEGDWFYEAKCAANYKGNNLFNDKEMEAFRHELLNRTKWANKRGIKYYLVLVPDKMEIYPEHLPRQVIKVSDVTRYDQIVKLNNGSTINVIDIRKNLLAHKKDGFDLYQHTDDHWNDLGAYYGYQEIMKRVSKDFSELKTIPLEEYKIEVEEHLGNLANLLNLAKEHPEPFVKLSEKYQPQGTVGAEMGYPPLPGISPDEYEIVTENAGKKLKCFIIRDSFTILMLKFLREHFARCVLIHDGWMYRMREDIIYKEKPDVILNIVLETRMQQLIEKPFTLNPDDEIEREVNIIAPNGKFVTTERNHMFIANRTEAYDWEKYTIINCPNKEVALLAWDKYYLRADLGQLNEIEGGADEPSDWARFKMETLEDGYVAIKANNGKYLSLDEGSVQIFATKDAVGKNEKFKIIIRK